MLPIYTAVNIHKSGLANGTTKPCLMGVENDIDEYKGLYVVKIFTQKHLNQANATVKEIYSYLLSKEFDLSMPKAALIWVDNKFIKELCEKYSYEDILEGYYFATEYIEDTDHFQISLFEDMEHKDTSRMLFAFDMLIQNTDRKIIKPNILLKEDAIFLIDHESSLNIEHPFDKYVELNRWDLLANGGENRGREHICWRILKDWNNKERVTFDEFEEYLRTLNINFLHRVDAQLEELGFETPSLVNFQMYLRTIMRTPHSFITILNELLLL